jgi:hypothetical protein
VGAVDAFFNFSDTNNNDKIKFKIYIDEDFDKRTMVFDSPENIRTDAYRRKYIIIRMIDYRTIVKKQAFDQVFLKGFDAGVAEP